MGGGVDVGRRAGLKGAAALVGAAGLLLSDASRSAPVFAESRETHAFAVTLAAEAPGRPVNRRLLGSNVGWAFRGDDLLAPDGEFAPRMLEEARRLAPTVLRYPGGTYSDLFQWDAPVNEHVFNRQRQPTLMDTRRFLELCEALDAEPLLTVNVPTGRVEDAVRWIEATNRRRMTSRRSGRPLPKVRFWEIGNEPYLREATRPELDLAPDEFAARANRTIRALRAVDPTVSIGLPLTSDTRAGVPVTPYPGFTRRVLAAIDQRIDFVALHDAYMPFAFRPGAAPEALYWGAMAAAATVRDDLAAMRRLLAELRPGAALPFAITEYAPLFTLGRGPTDAWSTTPAGALYVADLLRVLASEDERVLLANHWSLSANGVFGAIHGQARPRPVYEALRLVGEALRGERIDAAVVCATVAVAPIGLVAGRPALPLIEVLATRERDVGDRGSPTTRKQDEGDREGRANRRIRWRVLVINKDPARGATGRLSIGGARSARATQTTLRTADVLDASDTAGIVTREEHALVVPSGSDSIAVELPRHSIALVTLEAAA